MNGLFKNMSKEYQERAASSRKESVDTAKVKRETAIENAMRSLTSNPLPVCLLKYANRKLYMPGFGVYITIDQCIELLKAGCDIKVVDYKTNNDATNELYRAIAVHYINAMQPARLELLTKGFLNAES